MGDSENQREWLESYRNDADYRNKLNTAIQLSGKLLETKVNSFLSEKGYQARSVYYLDSENEMTKSREIDIYAYKQTELQEHSDLGRLSSVVRYKIIGDCRFYLKDHLLFFEIDDSMRGNIGPKLPYFLNGGELLPFLHDKILTEDDCTKLTGISEYCNKIIVFNPEKLTSEDQGNKKSSLSDVYGKCEQILSAMIHFNDREKLSIKTEYQSLLDRSGVHSRFNRIYNDVTRGNEILDSQLEQIITRVISEESAVTFSGNISINLVIPILVVDERTKIFKAVIDESLNISDLEERPYCIYLYAPSDIDKYDSVLGASYYLPIIVCNFSNLGECIQNIENGIKSIQEEITRQISKDSMLRELLSIYMV